MKGLLDPLTMEAITGPFNHGMAIGLIVIKLWKQILSVSVKINLTTHIAPDRGLVSLFNGISTFVGYLMPKPFS